MTPIPTRLHTDQPWLRGGFDVLQRNGLVNQIVEAIQESQPPLVLGVHGDWGQGKTSLMHGLNKRLSLMDDANPCAVVWFEAWRYQHEEKPIVALLQEIRRGLERLASTKAKAKKLGEIAFRGALAVIEDATKIVGIHASKVDEIGKAWEKEHLEEQLSTDQIQSLLDQAVEAALAAIDGPKGYNPKRLVVFIDDLDRCERGTAFKLLEGLKLFLNLKSCVFVLGMNKQVLEDAIACEFSSQQLNKQPDRIRAAAYMEKICQTIWHVPPVKAPEKYLVSLLKDRLPVPLVKAIERVCNCEQSGCSSLPPNPRRLKALANAILVLEQMYPLPVGPAWSADKLDQEARAMVFMAFLTQNAPELYRMWQFHGAGLFESVWHWISRFDGNPLPEAAEKDGASPSGAKSGSISGFDKAVQNLVLPYQVGISMQEGDPRKLMTTFPDPSDAAVIWVQPLLVHALQVDQEDKALLRERLARYL